VGGWGVGGVREGSLNLVGIIVRRRNVNFCVPKKNVGGKDKKGRRNGGAWSPITEFTRQIRGLSLSNQAVHRPDVPESKKGFEFAAPIQMS